jgi:hypothetical protein
MGMSVEDLDLVFLTIFGSEEPFNPPHLIQLPKSDWKQLFQKLQLRVEVVEDGKVDLNTYVGISVRVTDPFPFGKLLQTYKFPKNLWSRFLSEFYQCLISSYRSDAKQSNTRTDVKRRCNNAGPRYRCVTCHLQVRYSTIRGTDDDHDADDHDLKLFLDQASAVSSSPGTVCNQGCVGRVMRVIQFRCVRTSNKRACTSSTSDRLELEAMRLCRCHGDLIHKLFRKHFKSTNAAAKRRRLDSGDSEGNNNNIK